MFFKALKHEICTHFFNLSFIKEQSNLKKKFVKLINGFLKETEMILTIVIKPFVNLPPQFLSLSCKAL